MKELLKELERLPLPVLVLLVILVLLGPPAVLLLALMWPVLFF